MSLEARNNSSNTKDHVFIAFILQDYLYAEICFMHE
jgi:hypothetical protein